MAIINAPGRIITIEGEPTQVRFTVNRLIAVEERFGSLEKVDEAMSKEPLKAVRFLLWVSTGRKEDEADFGDLDIRPHLASCIRLVTEAFSEAVGSADVPVDPTQPETAPTPGTTS